MDTCVQLVKGDFDRPVLLRYLGVVCVIYWGLIFSAIGFFPEHKFSIMSYTYSALGSYDDSNNPQYWWLFCTAMTLWGIAMIPVVLYNYRRLATVSPWLAAIGAFFMMLGGIGISLVGIFPDAHGLTFNNYEIREIHKWVALGGAGGYMLSNIIFGVILIIEAVTDKTGEFNLKWLIPPYVIWGGIFGTGLYFQFQWEKLYPQLKAAAIAAGQPVPGHFGAALNTRYSFPLWENLVIYSLFVFIAWFAIALPEEVPERNYY